MRYQYQCEKCELTFDLDFAMGKAPKTAKCECGEQAQRYYGGVSFILKGGGWPSKNLKFNADQTQKNKDAGKRMEKNRRGTELKTVAHKYADGSVKEV